MKSILLVLVAMLVGLFAGCHNPVETTQHRFTRLGMITELQLQMAVDDWDYFWLYDRNTNLTQWHPRVGR